MILRWTFRQRKKCTATALYLYFTTLNCSRSFGVKLRYRTEKLWDSSLWLIKMKWISLTTKLLLRSRRLSSWPRPNASKSTWWRTSHCHVASNPNWVRLAGREQTQSENTNTLELQVKFNYRLWLFAGKIISRQYSSLDKAAIIAKYWPFLANTLAPNQKIQLQTCRIHCHSLSPSWKLVSFTW